MSMYVSGYIWDLDSVSILCTVCRKRAPEKPSGRSRKERQTSHDRSTCSETGDVEECRVLTNVSVN